MNVRKIIAVPVLALAAGAGLAACGPVKAPAAPQPTATAPAATATPSATTAPPAATTAPTTPAPVSTYVPAQPGVLPDSSRTPGAANPAVTQADIGSTICVAGWTATIRPPESYTSALKREQLAGGYVYRGDMNPADYEEDHMIPLEIGGAPSDPRNLWPEPYAGSEGARAKDVVENRLHREVCDGAISLAAARQEIVANWASQPAAPSVPTTTAPTKAPPVQQSAPAAGGGCSPRSAAGNCYKSGEFCPAADHGITGTDAHGGVIACKLDGARWRWN